MAGSVRSRRRRTAYVARIASLAAVGRLFPIPDAMFTPTYTVLNHMREVPDAIWSDPTRVVERFVPERASDGYAMRVWLFMSEVERCMRHVSSSPIIKGANTLRIEPAQVPPALREKRRHLGFD